MNWFEFFGCRVEIYKSPHLPKNIHFLKRQNAYMSLIYAFHIVNWWINGNFVWFVAFWQLQSKRKSIFLIFYRKFDFHAEWDWLILGYSSFSDFEDFFFARLKNSRWVSKKFPRYFFNPISTRIHQIEQSRHCSLLRFTIA